ncbi:hypothetical protein TL16_g09074 [Triparma laevis f. inornata]|uniref:FAD-binding PCMH-type domain-containing protein n=1 Tax=Triparma laevis f. inornata TaxID=1714386 RepID=A0A9W7B965_9STRA|nr:hypothetical protein TL16_g09074 [Triparma laevis f. inornata]
MRASIFPTLLAFTTSTAFTAASDVVGAGHSFSAITLTDEEADEAGKSLLLNLDNYTGIISCDEPSDEGEVETTNCYVRAGTRLRDLNDMLESRGLAFINLGATAAQSVAGAISTSTHGTGREIGSISTAVRGLKIVDSNGDVITADSNENVDVYTHARTSMGAFGVIMEVTLNVVPIWKMKRTIFDMPLETLISNHDDLYKKYSRFQWSYIPYADPPTASVMIREDVDWDTSGVGCWDSTANVHVEAKLLDGSGGDAVQVDSSVCVDVSYKVLVDSYDRYLNRSLYTEMEMFVDVKHTIDVLKDFLAFQESVKDEHSESASLFCNMRYVAADDIPTSMMFRERCGGFFVHYDGGSDYDGRSGRVRALRQRVGGDRERVDPNGLFLNDYLRERIIKK